jgi:hypothetical protein
METISRSTRQRKPYHNCAPAFRSRLHGAANNRKSPSTPPALTPPDARAPGGRTPANQPKRGIDAGRQQQPLRSYRFKEFMAPEQAHDIPRAVSISEQRPPASKRQTPVGISPPSQTDATSVEPGKAQVAATKRRKKQRSPATVSLLPQQTHPFVAPGCDRADDPQPQPHDEQDRCEDDADHTLQGVTVASLVDELRDDGTVLVPKLLREITGNGDQALVLAQVLYWFSNDRNGRPRARIQRGGKRWFYKTHRDFAAELGVKPRQVKDCLQALKNRGLIEIGYHRADGFRTSFYRLVLPGLVEAIKQAIQARNE